MFTQIVFSPEAKKAIAVGKKEHWHFRVVGSGEPLKEPVYKNQWWYEPFTPNSNIPQEGNTRLNALRRAGIRFQGVVVAHEAPRLLTAAKKVEKKPDSKISLSPDILTVLGSVASVFLMMAVFVFSAFFQAVLVDPALIVVLEDGTWVEVMTWYE